MRWFYRWTAYSYHPSPEYMDEDEWRPCSGQVKKLSHPADWDSAEPRSRRPPPCFLLFTLRIWLLVKKNKKGIPHFIVVLYSFALQWGYRSLALHSMGLATWQFEHPVAGTVVNVRVTQKTWSRADSIGFSVRKGPETVVTHWHNLKRRRIH